MKKIVGVIATVLVLGGMSARAQDAQRYAMAEELLNVMHMQDTLEKSFASVKQMMPAQMGKMEQAMGATNLPANVSTQTGKMMDMIAEELSWNKMKANYIALYAETFTEQEMKDIVTFYKSPAGQAFIKKQPELMKRSMEMSQKAMAQIMPKIQALITKELKETPATPSVQNKSNK